MNPLLRGAVLLLPLLALPSCNDANAPTSIPDPGPGARVMVTAETTVIEPTATVEPHDGLGRLGVTNVQSTYRLTTPSGEPFSFDVVAWKPGAAGSTSLAVAHVRDGSTVPADETSLAAAGIVVSARGLESRSPWFAATGDGLVRVTVKGRIAANQTIAVETESDVAVVIDIDVGDRSVVNRPGSDDPDDIDLESRQTIYSSDSPLFGIPTVAVSGDRTSVVCYEGDRGEVQTRRYEMRLQHDEVTQVVTGGGSLEASIDSGYWRDHEIAALYNVLAVARSDADGASVRLSFDRGASFAQEVVLADSLAQARLVQIAIAADYTLAVTYWIADQVAGTLLLRLVEGVPVAFDGTGSPTWFQFGTPTTVYSTWSEAAPLTTGIAWSTGGDLVIGHGATRFDGAVGSGWRSITQFRCAVRRHGEAIEDHLVDQQEIFGMDQTVAALGSGTTMPIVYAYEVQSGIRLAVSEDGGATFTKTAPFGQAGDHLPSVFARTSGGTTLVDVLYLASRPQGLELHRSRWTDWPSSVRIDERLTHASLQVVAGGASPMPGLTAMRNTQVSVLGYDAVLDGDRIVVVHDEVTTEALWWVGPMWGPGSTWSTVPSTATFTPAQPPPLAPGMTEVVPPVDPSHAHQLVLSRFR